MNSYSSLSFFLPSRTGPGILLYLLLILFTFTSSIAQSQKSKDRKTAPIIKLGDSYFNRNEFYEASQLYARALRIDSANAYAMNNMAESCRMFFDYKTAERLYKKLADHHSKEFRFARFWYATMLKDNGNFEKAIYQYKKFREEATDTDLENELYREKATQEIQGCEDILNEPPRGDIDKHAYKFRALPKPVNSPEGEFASVILESDSFLLVTSSRKGAVGHTKDKSFGGALSDMYKFQQTGDTSWTQLNNTKDDFQKVLNTPFSESSGSITGDKNRFYFTRCDEAVKVDNYQEFNCAIYVSKKVDGKWEKAVRLNENINMPGQWNSQPSVSPDGNILFFVSKRPGGFGMHDIWYSTCNGDDSWGAPLNLGDRINTLFIDMTPRYYSEQKVLFFASNGHRGRGGLDIFMAREEDGFEKIINLGPPFNSNRDDFYFVLGEKKGYLTSNREGGTGYDDIYTFNIKSPKVLQETVEVENYDSTLLAAKPEPPEVHLADLSASKDPKNIATEISGTVQDSLTGKPLWNQVIMLKDKNGNIVAKTNTDQNGNYSFNVPNGNYSVDMKGSNNQQVAPVSTKPVQKFTTKPEPKDIQIAEVVSTKDPNHVTTEVSGTLMDSLTGKPLVNEVVLLKDKSGTVVSKTTTDKNGNYSFKAPNGDFVVVVKESSTTKTLPVAKQNQKNINRPVVDKAEEELSMIDSISGTYPEGTKSIDVEGSIAFKDNGKPASGSVILLYDEYNNIVKTTKTDSKGTYKFLNLPSDRKYKIVLQQNRLRKQNEGVVAGKIKVNPSNSMASKTLFENIYFDFNKYELRPEAKKTLESVADYCQKNPSVQVELSSYTDSYGDAGYNRMLSGKRGVTAQQYLSKNGVSPSSMVVSPKGESKAAASNDSEVGRQLNRRIEFYILGGTGFESPYMTEIIPPKKTLYSLAKQYNMTMDELRAANGLTGNELKAYAPLRVKRGQTDHGLFAPSTREMMRNIVSDERKFTDEQRATFDRNKERNVKLHTNEEYKAVLDSINRSKGNPAESKGNGIERYAAQQNNTLFSISKLYGVTVQDLKNLNGLDSDTIYVNQIIRIDISKREVNSKGYLVKEGDTLEEIAKRFALTTEELIAINHLDGYVLRRNMILKLRRDN